ncbi:MAG: bifunctional non-ous end joining protein LigD [Pseudonocardiales bacterium]|nr:bifunctional non-ous end joining protein LigD [Pseudonocardiales bacterium]
MAEHAPGARGSDALEEYRRKRHANRTPEPVPEQGPLPTGNDDTFVVQEHHARALHWDFRLERNGVLVSWAVPKGLPMDPKVNHLAVQTEDHPLDYATFEGGIPAGEYGGGQVKIWDRGHYQSEKWTDREVKVVLTGQRIQGRYVLIRTNGKNWIMHRMDPPTVENWQAPPQIIRPMLAPAGELPPAEQDAEWAYETKWDGARAVVFVDGGRIRILSRNDLDVSASYPELRYLGEALGTTQVVLDGEIVAFGADGRPSFGRLQRRMHVTKAADVRRLSASDPVVYLIFDLLHLDGRPTLDLSYTDRRALLEGLELSGLSWQTPPYFTGRGADVLRASQENGLEGIVAKRRASRYQPGRRSPDWRKIKNVRAQEVIVAGWKPGKGRRSGTIGSLLLGIPEDRGLVYVGNVGTGFTDAMLDTLLAKLMPLSRKSSPFADELSRADSRDAKWVTPKLVGEVSFTEWTADGRLRHPSWRGLRPDKSPDEVVRES